MRLGVLREVTDWTWVLDQSSCELKEWKHGQGHFLFFANSNKQIKNNPVLIFIILCQLNTSLLEKIQRKHIRHLLYSMISSKGTPILYTQKSYFYPWWNFFKNCGWNSNYCISKVSEILYSIRESLALCRNSELRVGLCVVVRWAGFGENLTIQIGNDDWPATLTTYNWCHRYLPTSLILYHLPRANHLLPGGTW